MNFKSLRNLVDDISKWSKRIDFDYDYIVGVPNSGHLVAHILSACTGKPVNYGKVLDGSFIVDDSLMTGKTISWWKKHFPNSKFGVVYIKAGKETKVDTYCEVVPPSRMFEWNMFKSGHLPRCMMDIDGILCRDPTKKECDYGGRMVNFYKTVKPLRVPTRTVGWLVTCRLTKYRPETMEWLAQHNIDAKNLVMRPSQDIEHSDFKAQTYSNSNAKLFIESSTKQAQRIASKTGRPVLDYERMVII